MSSTHSAGGGKLHRDGQLAEPAAEVKPGGQGEHAVAPKPENSRGAQALHVALLVAPVAAENFPAAQLTKPAPSVLCVPTPPTPGQYVPAAHVTGTLAFALAMYQPASRVQLERAAAPVVELEPCGHGAEPLVTSCVDCPIGLWDPTAVPPMQYKPAGHVTGV